MKSQNIRARRDELAGIAQRFAYHQMHIKRELCLVPYARDNGCAEGDVRHKMPVHNIEMQPVGARFFYHSGLFAHA